MSDQRFCPLCDRSFQDGEAVLKCEGCGVLHHPGCWVTNNGCATQSEHRVAPIAEAYASGARRPGAPAPHPGEGTRTAASPPPSGPIPLRPPHRSQPPMIGDDQEADEPPMIGAAPPPMVHRSLPSDVVPPVGGSPRRYTPPPGEQMPRKPMPKIYGRHRYLAYWYVPVAIALAVGVALGVIFAGERLFGGDDDPVPSSTETPGATTTTQPGETRTPGPTATEDPSGAASPSPADQTPAGRFSAGQTVEVFNTGDCLNVRTEPGVNNPTTGELNPAIICISDGTRVSVTDGPESAGSFTWWKVETVLGEGWAVEDYLRQVE